MINCQYIGNDEIAFFKKIIEEKQKKTKTTLRNIIVRVNNSYKEYLNNFYALEKKRNSVLLKTEVDEKTALQLCYSSPTKTFKFIKGKIFEIQSNQIKAFCPYCLLNRPATLDHYIGQTEFPEYSILFRNLIPCCYECNQKKGANWRKNRLRRFIHFYNDTFLYNSFLHAKLIYPRGEVIPKIRFFISKPTAMNVADYRIVKTHFKDLNLLEEYNMRANALVSSEIEVMKTSFKAGVPKLIITDMLNERAKSQSAEFGINYWQSILYITLANDIKLINSIY